MDVYIEKIKEKFGSFNYAELKTPYNPQNDTQHLFDMIPGLRSKALHRSISQNSPSNRSDLTLRIIKTADNNLSIVKKPASTPNTPTTNHSTNVDDSRRIVDLTENDGKPISAAKKRSLERRKSIHKTKLTKDLENEKNQSKNDDQAGKSYQVMRRKSVGLEKVQPKKVSSVTLKRKSIHSSSCNNLAEEMVPVKRGRPPLLPPTVTNMSKASQSSTDAKEKTVPGTSHEKANISNDNKAIKSNKKRNRSVDSNTLVEDSELSKGGEGDTNKNEHVKIPKRMRVEIESRRGILESVGLGPKAMKDADNKEKLDDSTKLGKANSGEDVINISDDETWMSYQPKADDNGNKERKKSGEKKDNKKAVEVKNSVEQGDNKEPR